MRQDIPTSIKDTAQDLAPDAIVHLYKMTLSTGVRLYFTPQKEVTWQGNVYSSVPCTMTQIEQDPQGRQNRPKFSFVNPAGVFTSSIQQGLLDNAEVVRHRILKDDLDNNRDFSVTELFRVAKIVSLNKDMAVVELRDVFDGHMFKFPARAYYPPEFPHVKLF